MTGSRVKILLFFLSETAPFLCIICKVLGILLVLFVSLHNLSVIFCEIVKIVRFWQEFVDFDAF